ncbi:hypothetical protein [Flavobacterium sp. 245]|uniref:hypothetical protein n=1 Tax=Flavobacterium sp. 245 TaxID=2512115 RepID=UPI00105E250B|nr:hypothetical protein [Flavobacterium sp. 245]TDP02467.1 hypothetical protein EV145_103457 [Flavobacterium sp. 245]
MFKSKFKALVQNKELSSTSFEVLNDADASKFTGGCRSLKSCGAFSGTCPELTSCSRYAEPEDS